MAGAAPASKPAEFAGLFEVGAAICILVCVMMGENRVEGDCLVEFPVHRTPTRAAEATRDQENKEDDGSDADDGENAAFQRLVLQERLGCRVGAGSGSHGGK
jgi:hypothetical protein